MAIAFDAAANSGERAGDIVITVALTIGSGLTNSILVVGSGVRDQSGGAFVTVTGVLWNTTEALTLAKRQNSPASSRYETGELWYLKNPTSGTHNVVVTYSAVTDVAGVGVASFQGVDQTSPIDATAGLSANTTSPWTASITTVAANAWIINSGYNSSDPAIAVNNSETSWFNLAGASNDHPFGAYKGPIVTPAATTTGWSGSEAGEVAMAVISLKPAVATAYEINAATGAYVLTGVAATLAAGRLFNADPGAYVLTGVAATVLATRVVDATPGAYVLTGAAATLAAGRLFDAGPGAYALAGADTTLAAGRLFDAGPGAYILTGADAALAAGWLFNAEPGAYTLTGADAALVATRLFNAEPGTYALTGTAATLAASRLFSAEPGEYLLTGAAATLLATRLIGAEPGAYTITGAAATLAAGRLLDAESGAYLLTGAAATLAAGRLFDAGPGTYLLTGTAATLAAGRLFNAGPGAYLLEGLDATFLLSDDGAVDATLGWLILARRRGRK